MSQEANVECFVRPDGTETWWRGKKRHREEGPAVILGHGTEYLYHQGWGYLRRLPNGNLAVPNAHGSWQSIIHRFRP